MYEFIDLSFTILTTGNAGEITITQNTVNYSINDDVLALEIGSSMVPVQPLASSGATGGVPAQGEKGRRHSVKV